MPRAEPIPGEQSVLVLHLQRSMHRRPGSSGLPDCHAYDAHLGQLSDMDLALALGKGSRQVGAKERFLQILVSSETPAKVA